MNNFAKTVQNRGIKTILGSCVTVAVDRTYNSRGAKDRRCINCGSVIAPESENGIEAFVLGMKAPLSEFEGEVIAVAKRKDIKKEYRIVVKKGTVFYEPHIASMLSDYLPIASTSYICLYEKSCGAVLFTNEGNERMYLLIKNISGHIGFPKGHIELGEDEKRTALREIYEETGIHTRIIENFREFYNYTINNFIRKKAVYFLGSFKIKDIKMCIREISEYKLLNYEDAKNTLSFQHDKEILEYAEKFIIDEGFENA